MPRWSGLLGLEPRLLLSATGPIISEFMAVNNTTLADEDGDFSDWVEVHNPTASTINLDGWYLTDDSGDLTKWRFPDVDLPAGAFLLVFASDKDRAIPGGELHASFRLASNGEPLALVEPNGVTIASGFTPTYPEQFADISYGLTQDATTLVASGADVAYHVPDSGDAGIGADWAQPGFDDSTWTDTKTLPSSSVVITEAATGVPDYVEIQNVSADTADTAGWTLAVSQSNFNINSVNATTYTLPATMAPGQVIYRTDTSGDNYWGRNINWSTSGNGWVLLIDDAGDVVDFVVWGFSPSAIGSLDVTVNGFNITSSTPGLWQGSSVSAGGANGNSLQRNGNADGDAASDFSFVSPQSKGATNEGLITPFPGGQVPTTTGVGFNTGPSGFDVTFYKANVTVGTLAVAEDVIADPGKQTTVVNESADVINYFNTVGGGHFGGDSQFPGTSVGNDSDDFVIEANGTIVIPQAGQWTFGVNSDDGFGLELTDGVNTFDMSFPDQRGPGDTLAAFDLPQAGQYDVRLVYFERAGGSALELFAAPGSQGAFDANLFSLVGDVANGGLTVTGLNNAIATDVLSDMHNVNASIWTRIEFEVEDPAAFDSLILKMKYDDGFVAYLNGDQVAARNAPGAVAWNSAATAEHPVEQAVVFEQINISGSLGSLVGGTNVLAIQGLNIAASDGDALILPELVASSNGNVERYFSTPTPGAANLPGFVAFVEDTNFNFDRGFYDTPFDVEITTATSGATIMYTTDGTEPTEVHGTVYSGPITINQTTVLRAAAFKQGFEPTDIDTQTYLFLADVLLQSPNGAAPPGFPSSWGSNTVDYGMDPAIVNDPTWGPQLIDALMQVSTISIVTDQDNLFDSAIGIYANPGQDGRDWERPASVELINPDLTPGFQIDAGIRIRGGFSRSTSNPKHAFRLFFRDEYGDAKLKFPFFGDEGVSEFDNLDLRTSQNYSWSFQGDSRNTMNRDVFSRDAQRDLGQPYTRSRYHHLYINGQYWGLFQSQERSEASYGESYFGGDKTDYDVIKVEAGPYVIVATDGNLNAWQDLWNQANAIAAEPNAQTRFDLYRQLQGLNPDGTRNPAYPVLLDADNLIDYMMIIFFGGNLDAPVSNFLSNNSPNNWYGMRNRNGNEAFRFFAHDSEHTLLNVNQDRTGPWNAGSSFNKSNPQWIHQQLMAVDEYRLLFADHVHDAFFNGGVMTPDAATDLFLDRANEIDLAIIAESARWGDAKRSTPFDKDDWQAAIDNIVNNYLPVRTQIVLDQLRDAQRNDGGNVVPAPLYPDVDAPVFNQHGGQVGPAFELTITNPNPTGVVYYTLDGTDPRQVGGAVAPGALMYDGTPLTLPDSGPVQARVLD